MGLIIPDSVDYHEEFLRLCLYVKRLAKGASFKGGLHWIESKLFSATVLYGDAYT